MTMSNANIDFTCVIGGHEFEIEKKKIWKHKWQWIIVLLCESFANLFPHTLDAYMHYACDYVLKILNEDDDLMIKWTHSIYSWSS